MAALTNEQIIEAIGEKTILELSELIKAMEEKFGVTAAAPVAVVAGGAAGGGAAEEEKTEFTVTLKGLSDPGKKIGVIKEVRNVIPGLGWKKKQPRLRKLLQPPAVKLKLLNKQNTGFMPDLVVLLPKRSTTA